ncbi:DivIVA domain-containing protein [Haloechinothrix halophila]|uniref:DivIVA domain-containing protein n=1 Tax=Haloechinothrix halophila TaxID=1069073 RepID=UPI000415F256|nr:DivIVA domain-containing protein [Haloechinothrix halophila]
MYRVFEALDELVTIVEEARGVPMTSSCVVPRGDVLELLDDVRDALPGEVDDAQDVLDKRDEIVNTARQQADETINSANADAEQTLADARAEAERLVADARSQADQILADADAEADRAVAAGRAEYDQLTERARGESERMIEAGRDAYDRSVQEGLAEQARLVADTEVVRASHSEAARIVDDANAEADRQRNECDVYVDDKLAEFADLLSQTLRTVDQGRNHLRGGAVGSASGYSRNGYDY